MGISKDMVMREPESSLQMSCLNKKQQKINSIGYSWLSPCLASFYKVIQTFATFDFSLLI
jgi:hypothetical protein